MSSPIAKENEETVYGASKTLAIACYISGGEELVARLDGFHHSDLGEMGDWIITCKRANWLDRLLFKLRGN